MPDIEKRAIIISATSDIGFAFAQRLKEKNWQVFGSYRNRANGLSPAANFLDLDLRSKDSIDSACQKLGALAANWDLLIICPGMLEPVAPFAESDVDQWEESITVNFTRQLRVLKQLLGARNKNTMPAVLFFAGGGTNSAPQNMSAYTVSKIALIKMCELLDAEIDDCKFIIVGPGWVKTKIHQAVLNAGEKAGAGYKATIEKMATDDFVPMNKVIDSCLRLINGEKEVVSGRNFSTAHDNWDDQSLFDQLRADPNMYKLRRAGN